MLAGLSAVNDIGLGRFHSANQRSPWCGGVGLRLLRGLEGRIELGVDFFFGILERFYLSKGTSSSRLLRLSEAKIRDECRRVLGRDGLLRNDNPTNQLLCQTEIALVHKKTRLLCLQVHSCRMEQCNLVDLNLKITPSTGHFQSWK